MMITLRHVSALLVGAAVTMATSAFAQGPSEAQRGIEPDPRVRPGDDSDLLGCREKARHLRPGLAARCHGLPLGEGSC